MLIRSSIILLVVLVSDEDACLAGVGQRKTWVLKGARIKWELIN